MGAIIFQILEHVAAVEVEGNEDFPEHISAMRVGDDADRALAALLDDECDRALAALLDAEVDEVNSAFTALLDEQVDDEGNRALAALLDNAGDGAPAALGDVEDDDKAFAAFLDAERRK